MGKIKRAKSCSVSSLLKGLASGALSGLIATVVYDAENRMTSATNTGGQQSIYTYNAEGSRVCRYIYSQATWHVYWQTIGRPNDYGQPIGCP